MWTTAAICACVLGQPAADATTPNTTTAWVVFRDKGVAPNELDAAYETLKRASHPRAIERRRLRRTAPGLFDERDLPIAEDYLAQIEDTGAEVRVTSRWLNAVSVEIDLAHLNDILSLGCVQRIEIARPTACEPPRTVGGGVSGAHATRNPSFYGVAFDQADQINAYALHQLGFTGAGVRVGVLDTGFSRIHEAFNEPGYPIDIALEYDFLNNDANTAIEPGDLPDQHEHGTWILGAIGSYDPGVLVGTAYDATFILAKCEDYAGEYPAEEFMFVAALEYIEANGGDIATSSVAYYGLPQNILDGQTTVMAQGINAATDNGLHVFQGCGNSSHDADPATSSLLTPADGFDVISIGSVDVNGVSAWFTSDGPTADGRVKPELMARGLNTASVEVNAATGVFYQNGASMATPVAAGAVACLIQIHPEWTVPQLRHALFTTASEQVANGAHDPQFVRGYGIIDVLAAAYVSFCDADVTTAGAGAADARFGMPDGNATAADINYYINAWVAGDLAIADINTQGASPIGPLYGEPDGIITAADINFFVNAWVAGCP